MGLQFWIGVAVMLIGLAQQLLPGSGQLGGFTGMLLLVLGLVLVINSRINKRR